MKLLGRLSPELKLIYKYRRSPPANLGAVSSTKILAVDSTTMKILLNRFPSRCQHFLSRALGQNDIKNIGNNDYLIILWHDVTAVSCRSHSSQGRARAYFNLCSSNSRWSLFSRLTPFVDGRRSSISEQCRISLMHYHSDIDWSLASSSSLARTDVCCRTSLLPKIHRWPCNVSPT